MIANPNWFKRRKYSGWGLTPATWQGWAYIIVMIVPMILISKLHLEKSVQNVLTYAWIGIFLIDFIDLFIHLRKDEREKQHESIAERNASWVMVTVLAIGIAYQSAQSALQNKNLIDPFIFITIFSGLAAKALTNWYLRDK